LKTFANSELITFQRDVILTLRMIFASPLSHFFRCLGKGKAEEVEEEMWGENRRNREGGEIAEYREMGERREKDSRREGVVDSIGEGGEARRGRGREEVKNMLRGKEEKREKKG